VWSGGRDLSNLHKEMQMRWTDAVNASKVGYAYRLVNSGKEIRVVNRSGVVAKVEHNELRPMLTEGTAKVGNNFQPINGLINEVADIFPIEAQMRIFKSFDAVQAMSTTAGEREIKKIVTELASPVKGIKALAAIAGKHINEIHRIAEAMYTRRDFTDPDYGNELDKLIEHATQLRDIL
jgi:hypothetical protein